MISEFEVREKLAAVARNEIPLAEFERWLVPESWNMHSDSSPGAIDLVSSIHLLLSERYDGVRDDREHRSELLLLLNRINESVVIVGDSIMRRPADQLSASTMWVNPSPLLVLPALA